MNEIFGDGVYIFKVAVSPDWLNRFQGHFGQAYLGLDNSAYFFPIWDPSGHFLKARLFSE